MAREPPAFYFRMGSGYSQLTLDQLRGHNFVRQVNNEQLTLVFVSAVFTSYTTWFSNLPVQNSWVYSPSSRQEHLQVAAWKLGLFLSGELPCY